MNRVVVAGTGVVSPAGWGIKPFHDALCRQEIIPAEYVQPPNGRSSIPVRAVPPSPSTPAFLRHPRLRRSSPISHYALSAALEAVESDRTAIQEGSLRLGVVFCAMTGCVNYSRRFYHETWTDPTTASPLLFPETVFNAPASHLAAVLQTSSVNYTLVGDPSVFLVGLATASCWLLDNIVDACLVVGAEEKDWISAGAFRLFRRQTVLSEGAGALFLKPVPSPATGAVALERVTDPVLFHDRVSRLRAAQLMKAQFPPANSTDLLCTGEQGVRRLDLPEQKVWKNWPGPRLCPKTVLGEGLVAASAWQSVAAVHALQHQELAAANVSVVGCHQQAVGARFLHHGCLPSFNRR